MNKEIYFILMILLVAGPLHAKKAGPPIPPCTGAESEPVVEIKSQVDFNGIDADSYAKDHYDDLIGTIRNDHFCRFWDGSVGSYKVPIRIVVPKDGACDAGRLKHVGLIELMHPQFIGSPDFPPESGSGLIHGWNDPVYDSLLDQGYMEAWGNLRAPFLFGDPDPDVGHGGGGVVYMGFQANNFFGELDYIAALPENQGIGLHLQRPQDYAFLYRDVSKWLRQAKTPQNFINNGGRSDLCSVSDVIGFGYSHTSVRLKAVVSNLHHLNSTWGSADPIFPRGRVMDGMLLAGLLGRPKPNLFGEEELALFFCPDVTSNQIIPIPCAGPDDASEGPMVIVESETDIQVFDALGLRPGPVGHPDELDHYKIHEINAASHLEGPYFPLGPIYEFFGLDPALTRQNPLDRSPVIRADFINLLDKIQNNISLPDSKYLAAHYPLSHFGFGVVSLDKVTGNGFGGITLPQAAAPLGLYRGTDCHILFSPNFDISDDQHYALPPMGSGDLSTGRANYLLETSPASPAGLVCVQSFGIEGIFTPYQVVDAALGSNYCETLYPTRQAYSDRVTAAADQLIAERFLLPVERDEIIAAAEAEADKNPDCVPPL